MKEKLETVKVKTSIKKRLDKLKKYPRETYADTIERLIGYEEKDKSGGK